MKKVLFMLTAMVMIMSVNAQSNQLPEKIQNIKDRLDPAGIAGLYTLDEEDIYKKMKIKKPVKKLEVGHLVKKYNAEIKGMKSNNMGLLVKLGTDIKNIVQVKEYNKLWSASSDYKGKIEKLKSASDVQLTEFETALFEIVPKRKQKKYLKYKKETISNDENSIDVGDVFSLVGM